MRFSYSWLLDYLDTELSLDVLVEKLCAIGIEAECLRCVAVSGTLVVARVEKVAPHPNAQRLHVCQVFDGKCTVQVVCGASNVRPGLITVLARVGAILPNGGVTIDKVNLRGVDSCGMLCSRGELGLPHSLRVDGEIIELSDSEGIGDDFFSCEPALEVCVTPDRGDCLGVYGVARDLAAVGVGRLKGIDRREVKSFSSSPIAVDMQVRGIFSGRYIGSVRNQVSAPKWLRERLRSANVRSVSCIVDILNYVMLSFGRPMHVYDADRIEGNLIVRRAGNMMGQFLALNGKSYSLNCDDLVVVDDSGNVHCIAGIVGSELSKCTSDTRNIFLESAWYDPVDIALSSRRLRLSTDASYRFERFVDPGMVCSDLDLAASMIIEYCGGNALDVVCSENNPPIRSSFVFDPRSVTDIGSVSIEREEVHKILVLLGFAVDPMSGESWRLLSPSWRSDIVSSSSVVEEVLRIYGLDKIQEQAVTLVGVGLSADKYDKLRVAMLSEGLTEVVTLSFMSSAMAEKFGYSSLDMRIANPISSQFDFMRSTLLPNLLQVAANNVAQGCDSIAVFEIGAVYSASKDSGQVIGGLRVGSNVPRNLYGTGRKVDFFDAKSDVLGVFLQFGIENTDLYFDFCKRPYLHPVRSAEVYLAGVSCGYLGEVHPHFVDLVGLEAPVVCFEIFLDGVVEKVTGRCRSQFTARKYQTVRRDFAFLLDRNARAQSLVDVVKGIEFVGDVDIFDVYEGAGIPSGQVSVAISVVIYPQDHTLNEGEIKDISDSIIAVVHEKMGGVLRFEQT